MALLLGLGAPVARADTPGLLRVLVLGDSYSAGNGAGDYSGPSGCYRSPNNYAGVYARLLEESPYDLPTTVQNDACSGATTQAFTTSFKGQPPQEDAVNHSYQVIFITMGGDDLHFADIVEQCLIAITRDGAKCGPLLASAQQALDNGSVTKSLKSVLSTIYQRASSSAHIVLLGYPLLEGDPGYTLEYAPSPYYEPETLPVGKLIRALGSDGDQVEQSLVAQLDASFHTDNITFVSTQALFAGPPNHELFAKSNNPNRWFIQPRIDSEFETDIWYHPNPTGWAAEGQLLVQTIGVPSSPAAPLPGPPTTPSGVPPGPWTSAFTYTPLSGAKISCPDASHCWAIEDGQLIHSTDGGITWTLDLTPPNLLSEPVGFGCVADSSCMMSSGTSIVITTDDAATWSSVPLPAGVDTLTDLACAGTTCFAVGARGDGTLDLLSTSDLGTTWHLESVPTAAGTISGLQCNAVGTCALVGYDPASTAGTVAISSGPTNTWSVTSYPDDSVFSAACGSVTNCVAFYSVPAAQGGQMAAASYTANGGGTWSLGALPSGTTYLYDATCSDSSHCWALGDGPNGSVFSSANGGSTWSNQQGVEYLAGFGLSCPTAQACFINGSTDGGGNLNFSVVSTLDGGADWTFVETPVLEGIGEVACSSVDTCVAGGFGGNVTIQTTNGGQSWAASSGLDFPPNGSCFSCTGINSVVKVACAPGGSCFGVFDFGFFFGGVGPYLYRLDGGTWQSVALPGGAGGFDVSCPTQDTCYASTSAGVDVSYDGGSSWQQTSGAGFAGDTGGYVACSDATDCVASVAQASGSYLLATNDGGQTWQDVPTAPVNVRLLTCSDGPLCFASDGDEQLWQSDDSGESWTHATLAGVETTAISCPNQEDCWALVSGSTQAGVIATTDGGASWTYVGSGTGTGLDCPAVTSCFLADAESVFIAPPASNSTIGGASGAPADASLGNAGGAGGVSSSDGAPVQSFSAPPAVAVVPSVSPDTTVTVNPVVKVPRSNHGPKPHASRPRRPSCSRGRKRRRAACRTRALKTTGRTPRT